MSVRASVNARWIGLSQAARVFTQLASMTVLTRLLGPEDFGLMAMATVVTTFASMLRDLGTGAALVQKEQLSEETATAVFWFNLGVGFLVGSVLVLTAPMIARGFQVPGLTPLVWALAPSFPIASLTTAHQALLERKSDFKSLARIEVISSTLALAVAVTAAYLGAGTYSLVLQAVVVAVLSSGQLWLASGFRPSLRFSYADLRSLLGFSGNLATFNFVNYLSRNADNIVIGRYIGAAALGTYSLAYRLMLFPVQNLTFVANRALFPVMSRHQANLPEIASLYLRTVRVVVTVTAPMMLGLFVVRAPLVRLMFGPEWSEVAEVLAWLAPTGFIQSIVSTTGTVFMARGRTNILLRLGVMSTLLYVTSFLLGARYGIVELAAFYAIANVISAVPCLWMVMRELGASPLRLVEAIAAPLGSALIMALAISLFGNFVQVPPAYWREELAASVMLGALCYGGLLYLVFRQSPRDILTLIRGSGSPA